MFYALLAVFSAFIVFADQFTKFLTVTHIPQVGLEIPFWDGVVHFTRYHNTGMSFSMFEGGRWVFVVMTVLALTLMILAVIKNWVNHPVGLWALACIFGGAVGNFIDRLRLGYVIDMIEVEFVNFAVFNVADSFVVCGAILLVIYTLFFDRSEEEKPHDSAG